MKKYKINTFREIYLYPNLSVYVCIYLKLEKKELYALKGSIEFRLILKEEEVVE